MNQLRSLQIPKLVRASAGTGKTHELSARFIGILLSGESPEAILATTFTRKAASEIRERIFRRLAAAVQSVEHRTQLSHELGKPLAEHELLEVLMRLVRDQHRISIMTIDGFFGTIARAFSLELGLNPDWNIASTAELAEMQEQALSSVFEEARSSKNRDQNFAALSTIIKELSGGKVYRDLYRRIIAEFYKLYELADGTPDSAWGWLEPLATPPSVDYEGWAQRLLSVAVPRTSKGEPNKNWSKAFAELVRKMERRNLELLASDGLVKAGRNAGGSYYRVEIEPPLTTILFEINQARERDVRYQLGKRLRSIRHVAQLFSDSYRNYCYRTGGYSFDDIKRALSNMPIGEESSALYYRLDSTIRHVLLDEFQDTSRVEWRFFEPLIAEMLSKRDTHTFFCVGDVKQAIYGWRGGCSEIFDAIEAQWPHIEVDTREVTFRCAPAIIQFVNRFFSSIPQLELMRRYPRAQQVWRDRWRNHEAARDTSEGVVSLIATSSDKELHLERVVHTLVELHALRPTASIAVLVRSNGYARRIIAACNRIAPQLSVSEEGDSSLAESSVVRGFLSVLRYAFHPQDSLAYYFIQQNGLAEVLGIPPQCDYSNYRLWSQSLRTLILQRGIGVVLSTWIARFSSRYSETDRIRLGQLAEISYQYTEPTLSDSEPFIDFIRKEKVSLPSEAAIRVMTIHRSKGLEFEVVVLPELDAAPKTPRGLMVTRSHPLAQVDRVLHLMSDEDRDFFPELREAYDEAKEEQVIEALNLLYVAFTRARHGLYLLVPSESKTRGMTYRQLITESMGLEGVLQDQVIEGEPDWTSEASVARVEREVFRVKPYKEKNPDKGKSLIHQRPSAGVTRESRSLSLEQITVQKRGTFLHACLEQIEWYTPDSLPQGLVEQLALTHGIDPDFAGQCAREIRHLFAIPEFAAIFERKNYTAFSSVQVRREQPFRFAQENRVIAGVIDRMMVCFNHDHVKRIEFFDFKSKFLNEEDTQYQQQMAAYGESLCQWIGAAGEVEGYLVSLQDGKRLRVFCSGAIKN
jgi:ATP-dependent helicase/nuclease subunit A